MSKQISLGVLLLALLTALPLMFGPVAVSSASYADSSQPAARLQQDPVAIKTARNAALIAATEEVLKETSELRQLSIIRPVQSSTQSRAEIERMIIKNLDEEITAADMHAIEVILKKLGLAPADFQYRTLMVRLLTEQVAGYYDPKTREFHLADWIDLDGQRPIMAHELTHALQDQHFNLRRFEHWPKGDSDAELATHALIEGDATLSMALYVANNPLRALAFLKSLGSSGMTSAELDKAPRALRESLLFPYQEGTNWTRAVYKQGGWPAVSQAFTTLPQSTEQILHPDKYFAHEAPVKVTLPDITPLLNVSSSQSSGGSGQTVRKNDIRLSQVGTQAYAGSADVPSALNALREPLTAHRSLLPSGWRRLTDDVQGEWGFYLILDQFLKSPADSRRAAAGWGGDRFAVYEGPKGEVLIVSLSVWDTENDAREFVEAYAKRTQLRYNPERTTSGSSEAGASNALILKPSEGKASIELQGKRVLILEGVPAGIDPDSLLRRLKN